METDKTEENFDWACAIRNPWIRQYNEEFVKLGRDLLEEVVDCLHIGSLSRKVFESRTVKAGEIIRYDKDKDRSAYVVCENGEAEERKEGCYVYPPEFEITAYPNFSDKIRSSIFESRPSITNEDIVKEIKNAQEKALCSIQTQEDTALIKLLKKAGEQNASITKNPYDIFRSIIYEVERHRLICDKILLNRKDVQFIKDNRDKFKDNLDLGLDLFAPTIEKELKSAGYVGKYNASLLITTPDYMKEDSVPEGELIAVSSPPYLGGMPIRVAPFSEPCSDDKGYGWFWYQLMSMVLINTNAVALGKIAY